MRIMTYLMQLLRKANMAKPKKEDRFDNLEDEIDELRDALDCLYNIINPKIPRINIAEEDDGYRGPTAQIPAEVYDKILEYSENKDFVFMGVA